MKVMRFGGCLFVFSTLIACANISNIVDKAKNKPCYPLGSLNDIQQSFLGVDKGNPIFLVAGEQLVCSCFSGSDLAGATEGDKLLGDDEGGQLAGANEGGELAGSDESGQLLGADEGGQLAGADERGRLAGADEKDRLMGADEKGRLAGSGEGSKLAGASEGSRLWGAGERGRVDGRSSTLSCRLVKGCSGFKLVGYSSENISVANKTGTKSVSTECVTW